MCKVMKPLEAFRARKNRAVGGRESRCKACEREAYQARPIREPVMEGTKLCRECRAEKAVTEFTRHRREKDGRSPLCKACHLRRHNEYRDRNYEHYLGVRRTSGKAGELRRNYGITQEAHAMILKKQGGGCAICGRTVEEEGRHLAVDHDGTCCNKRRGCAKCVRGLLCRACNNGLGHFADDPKRLRRAAAYLTKKRPLLDL